MLIATLAGAHYSPIGESSVAARGAQSDQLVKPLRSAIEFHVLSWRPEAMGAPRDPVLVVKQAGKEFARKPVSFDSAVGRNVSATLAEAKRATMLAGRATQDQPVQVQPVRKRRRVDFPPLRSARVRMLLDPFQRSESREAETESDTSYEAEYWEGDELRARAAFSVPRSELRLRVTSCFGFRRDAKKGGRVATAIGRANAEAEPHLSLHLGDQVYLDGKILLLGSHEARAHRCYSASWWARRQEFAAGLHLFIPDDHELWNNWPKQEGVVARLFKKSQWMLVAQQFVGTFQPPRSPHFFRALGAEFCVMNTRTERDDSLFLPEADFEALLSWINTRGVKVLAMSGSLLGEGGDSLGQFRLRYERLWRALDQSRGDVLVLCGDSHFSRLSGLRLQSGYRLFELISSPLSLVGLHSYTSPSVLTRFPVGPLAKTITPRQVTPLGLCTKRSLFTADDSFADLTFRRADGQVVVDIACRRVAEHAPLGFRSRLRLRS